jgi:AcrR family transcriptional regulator
LRAEIGERQRARTRERLIEAALRVFARLGPDTPSIDDFIVEAGVARGTFYNYFHQVEDLRVAVAGHVAGRLAHDMAAVRALADPAARVGCAMRMFMHKAAEDAVFGWVIVRIALVAAPLGPVMRANLAADVDAGLAEGRFRCDAKQAAYDIILGAAIMGMRSVLRGEAAPGHAEAVASMVLTALGAPDAATIANLPMDKASLAGRAKPAAARKACGEAGGRRAQKPA